MAFDKLEQVLTLDRSDHASEIQAAQKDMEGLGETSAGAGDRMQSAGKKMTAGFSAPLVGAAGASAKFAGDFDQAMTESIAVMGDVDGAMRDKLESTAREVATSTQHSHEDAAESFYFLSSAGLDAAESIEAMPKTAAFAEAGALNMADATDYATNVMSAFGYEADEMETVTDSMTATFQNHNQTAADMGNALQKIGPVASGVGMSLQETSAAVGMLGDVGYSGAEAATALRGGISALVNPTSQQADLMEELGVKATDSEGNMRDFDDIIRDLEGSGASTADVMALFGQEAGPAMSALLDQGGDALEENTKRIEEMEGATAKTAETQRKSFNAQLAAMKDSLKDVGITIGQQILPILQRFIDLITPAANKLSDMDDKMATATVAAGALVAAIGPMLYIFGHLINTVGPAITQLANLGGRFKLLLAPITKLVGGVGLLQGALIALPLIAIAGLVAGLATNFGGMRDQAMRVVSALQEALRPALEALGLTGGDTMERLVSGFKALLTRAEPVVARLSTLIADKLIAGIELLAQAIAWLVPRTQQAWTQISAAFTKGVAIARQTWARLQELTAQARQIFTQIKTTITTQLNAIWAVLQPFVGDLLALWREHGQGIIQEARQTWGALVGVVVPVLNQLRAKITQITAAVTAIWTRWTSKTKTDTQVAFGSILGIVRPILATLKSVIQTTLSAVSAFWDRWGSDILSALKLVFNTVIAIATQALDTVGTAIRVGLAVLRGDWTQAWTLIREYLSRTVERIRSTVSAWVTALVGLVTRLTDGITQRIRAGAQRWVQTFRSRLTQIRAAVTQSFAAIRQRISQAIQAIVTFVTGSLNNLLSRFRQILTSIRTFVTQTFTNIRTFIQTQLAAVLTLVTGTLNNILSTFTTQFNLVLNLVKDVWAAINDDTISVWSVIEQFIRDTLANLYGAVETQMGLVLDFFRDTLENIYSTVQTQLDLVLQYFQDILGDTVQAIIDFGADAVSEISGILDDMLGEITDMGSQFRDAGGALISSFADGIKGAASEATGAVGGVAGSVRERMPFSPAKKGPLDDIDESGPGLVNTLASGILGNKSQLAKAAEEAAEAADPSMRADMAIGAGSRSGQSDTAALLAELIRAVEDLQDQEIEVVGGDEALEAILEAAEARISRSTKRSRRRA